MVFKNIFFIAWFIVIIIARRKKENRAYFLLKTLSHLSGFCLFFDYGYCNVGIYIYIYKGILFFVKLKNGFYGFLLLLEDSN